MVFQQSQRPFDLLHVGLGRENGVIGHYLFQQIADSADGILFQTKMFQIFLIEHPDSKQNRCFFFVQITAVNFIRIQDVEIAVSVISAQIPVQKGQIIPHFFVMSGKEDIIWVCDPAIARFIHRSDNIGSAEQLVADSFETIQFFLARTVDPIKIHSYPPCV